ncbi:MAG: DUF3078 domain-containing protein [Psychroflexus sp.]|jgi:hypothetical protein|nr:DUF3078 domain-containing protein [Psychroflexus sp.]MDR9448578.1 DUF3078 domain-containing protein [Psychroflexus sp.]
MIKVFFFLLVITSSAIYSQNSNKNDTIKHWNSNGKFSLIYSQAAFNQEWLGGGTSNYAGNVVINYDLNYKKNEIEWDTKLLIDYGITKNDNQEFSRKTNDRLEVNSIVGKNINNTNWYYTGSFNFRTQSDKGYIFGVNEGGEETRTLQTKFLSPAYTNLGLGIQWKKNDQLKVNIAPVSGRLILADKMFTTTPGYQDGDFFGLDEGASIREEFGASLNGIAAFDIMKNISVENILNLFSNYLEDPQNVDIDYTLNLRLKVNKYISTNFTFQAIYDDNAIRGFQIREVLGAGLIYEF